MEYGLGLDLWSPAILGMLQRVQDKTVRRIMGGTGQASKNAMMRLARLEPGRARNELAHARFYGKLKNSLDPTIPATRFFHRLQQNSRSTTRAPTLASGAARNPLWPKLNLRNPIQTIMRTDGAPEPLRLPCLHDSTKTEHIEKSIQSLKGRVAEAIPVPSKAIPVMLTPAIHLTRKEKSLLFRWRLGQVCSHQTCLCCGQELSRQHGIQCSGASENLTQQFPTIAAQPRPAHANLIDEVLAFMDQTPATTLYPVNAAETHQPATDQSPARRTAASLNAAIHARVKRIQRDYGRLATAIEAILQVCRGIQVSDSGYWIHHEDPAALNPVAHVSCPLTGNESSNPALTARRRAHATAMQMPVWRPRFASLPLDQALASSRRLPARLANATHDRGGPSASSSPAP